MSTLTLDPEYTNSTIPLTVRGALPLFLCNMRVMKAFAFLAEKEVKKERKKDRKGKQKNEKNMYIKIIDQKSLKSKIQNINK